MILLAAGGHTFGEMPSNKPPGSECHTGAASFDCTKAGTIIESTICSNNVLATKDCLLGYVFRFILDRFSGQARQTLLSDQRSWIHMRDKFCQSKATTDLTLCLTVLTDDRAKSLIRTFNPNGPDVFSTDDFTETLATPTPSRDLANNVSSAPAPVKPAATSTPEELHGSLVESQNDFYQLPDATSDFIGDWCGWSRLTACQPQGSCDDDQRPESLTFQGGDGKPVSLHYEILGSSDTSYSDIRVASKNPRTVVVTATKKDKQAAIQAFSLIDMTDTILSVDTSTIEDTDSVANEANTSDTETRIAEMHKCTVDFIRAQEEWVKEHNMMERGSVEGSLSN
jgi:uncharacterized protein YecT (DUF1311 family)